MNYKVLYRKYRPNTFETIIGQEYIIKTLKNSITNNMISHAYIFSGPRGTGKTSTAKIFSKAINCLNNTEGSPCGNCEFCTNFDDNPDIIEIDAASNNGVDQIRILIDNIKLTPSNGKYKVYIIDESHMLTTSAFNALLLTLEEPPAHAIFILATTNIESVPITILSRCQRFDFKKITIKDIVLGLKNICDIEKIEYDEDALTEIAYLSEGGMRDALSLLDQLSKNQQKITLELVEKQVKTISQKGINELLNYIEDNNVEKCLEIINDYEKRAIDFKNLIKRLIDSASDTAKNIKKTGRINRLNFEDYKKLIFNLSECLTRINININPYTLLEMIILEMTEINQKADLTVKNREDIFSHKEQENLAEIVENKISVDFINKRINNCFVNAQKSFLETAKEKIKGVDSAFTINGKIRSILMDSNLVAASDQYMIFSCSNDYTANDANSMITDIEKTIKEQLNLDYKVVFISEKQWIIEKTNYIDNIKANKKYTYIKENNEIDSDNTEINSVFDIDKVEII